MKEKIIKILEERLDASDDNYECTADELLNLHIVSSSLQADIRNKLSPVENLVALLEDNAPQKYIDAEIEAVKKSVEYLSNYR